MEEGWDDYAVLVSLYTREEAEVMASALRADGVDAFAENSNQQGMTWFYTLALGGLRVFVRRSQVEDAKELVRARLRENADAHPEDRVQRRDRGKIWLMAAVLYGMNGIWMFVQSMHWAPEDRYDAMEWLGGVTTSFFGW